MNVLIILAHPEPRSYNAALARAAAASFAARGDEVRMLDLCAAGFDPVERADHYAHRQMPGRFDAQVEQRFNSEEDTLPADVGEQIGNLHWADFVLFQFPLWWFGVPAVLKGWMDRVFAYGAIYSSLRRFDTGIFRGKRAMLSVTTGSPAEACMHDGQEGDTRLLLWPFHYALHYVGFTVLEPKLVTGVRGAHADGTDAARQARLDDLLLAHADRFSDIDRVRAIAFNGPDDWDERRKLKPGAPVYSPFIRHDDEA